MGNTPVPVFLGSRPNRQCLAGMALARQRLAIAAVFAFMAIASPAGLLITELVGTPARELRDVAYVRDLLWEGRLSFEQERSIGRATALASFGP